MKNQSKAEPPTNPGGLEFPSPLIPVDVYAAWLLGDWMYLIDAHKVAGTYFGVDGQHVFMSEGESDESKRIGRLPDGWDSFHFCKDAHGVTLIGPAPAVTAAKSMHEQSESRTRELHHLQYDDLKRLDRTVSACGPVKAPRKAVAS